MYHHVDIEEKIKSHTVLSTVIFLPSTCTSRLKVKVTSLFIDSFFQPTLAQAVFSFVLMISVRLLFSDQHGH